MTTQNTKSAAAGGAAGRPPEGLPEEVVDRLAGLLPAEELQDALKGLAPEQITGSGGLLTQLAGRVIETALGAELTEHLGYPPGQAPVGGAGNVRNGSTPKTVQTELGPVDIKNPRDRAGTFDPQLVVKRQTRLAGLDDKILGDVRDQIAPADEVLRIPLLRAPDPRSRWAPTVRPRWDGGGASSSHRSGASSDHRSQLAVLVPHSY
jgi:hypothetical protein